MQFAFHDIKYTAWSESFENDLGIITNGAAIVFSDIHHGNRLKHTT